MRRWAFLLFALAGCRGESVEAAPDTATTDAVTESGLEDAPIPPDSMMTDSGIADATTLDSAVDSTFADSAPDSISSDGSSDGGLVSFESAGNSVQCGATRGGRMVFVGASTPFCIDVKEVTAAEYLQFLGASDRPTSDELAVCDWNAAQFGNPTLFVADSKPATNVDFCDAWAYCKWAGKHLCGNTLDAGRASTEEPTDSQWTTACMNGAAATDYPTGSALADAGACNIGLGSSAPAPVGSYPGCKGIADPYDKIFDMAGNVLEWDQSGTSGAFDSGAAHSEMKAGIRGGSYASELATSRCKVGAAATIATKNGTIGFRCCKGPPL